MRSRNKICPLAFAILVGIVGLRTTMAQSSNSTTMPIMADSMNPAREFQATVDAQRAAIEAAAADPQPLADLVLSRLRAGQGVTDASVLSVVRCYSGYEGRQPTAAYPRTIRLIEELTPLIDHRAGVVGELLKRKGQLLALQGDRDSAVVAYAGAVEHLREAELRMSQLRLEVLVGMGDQWLLSGNTKDADAAYLRVLSFDWYKIEDPEMQRTLKELYLAAGRGVISCRRHNLVGLRELTFVSSTLSQLQPILDQAIAEAQGNAQQ